MFISSSWYSYYFSGLVNSDCTVDKTLKGQLNHIVPRMFIRLLAKILAYHCSRGGFTSTS
jgi:hypothetical protein